MSFRQRLKKVEDALAASARCPECAPREIKTIEKFDDSPLPSEDARTYEELCRIPMSEISGLSTCPRCGGPMPISVMRFALHPACRHTDFRKRLSLGVQERQKNESPR